MRGNAHSAIVWSGHGAPVFTSDLLDPHARCEPAGPLRHVAGFPGLRLLRVLRPIPAASAGDGPYRRSAGSRPVRGPSGWFPRSLSNRLTGEVPSYAPAASPRVRRRPSPWPPRPATLTDRGVPRPQVRAGARCCPAQIRQVSSWCVCLRGVQPLVPVRTPSRLACRTRTIWQCWPVPALSGLLATLPNIPGIGLPQASPTRCDGPAAVSFHHRTVR